MTLDLVDTHCHLDAEQFADEGTGPLLARAAAAGVRNVVTIGTNVVTSARAVELAARHHMVSAAVGVDPNDAAEFDDTTLDEVRRLAENDVVVAVGEIGLDYHWDRAPRAQQAAVFRAQLDLARALPLPVVIHSRDADDDTAAILETWAADHPWRDRRPLGVMHCFSGSLDHARRMVRAGFLVSLAGNVTFRNAAGLHEVARGLDSGAFVLETDAPWLSPVPYRGRRNEPARVRDIAEQVAAMRNESVEAVARATYRNARRLFRLAADAPADAPATDPEAA